MFSTFEEMASWLAREWRIAVPLAALIGSYALIVGKTAKSRAAGWLALALAVALGWLCTVKPSSHWVIGLCFAGFAGLAVASAVATIAQANPVYAALHFAMAVLSVCGLFLLQAASFLAAATVIVYAGAIVVTFLFVIMLAHQSGRSTYDLNPRQPLLVGLVGFCLMGAMLSTLSLSFTAKGDNVATIATAPTLAPAANIAREASPLAKPTEQSGGGVLDLGRTLFSDYLWATELAGTILLASTIGAIAVAAQRKGAVA